MNEQNEISGDLQDEYLAIQEAELLEEGPIMSLDDQDLDAWYVTWLAENGLIDEDFEHNHYSQEDMIRDFHA